MIAGVVLYFDRLTDGTLVAVHRGVAAIVHPLTSWEVHYRWTLAGDGFGGFPDEPRPHGRLVDHGEAVAVAAAALGVHLGVTVDSYEIAP